MGWSLLCRYSSDVKRRAQVAAHDGKGALRLLRGDVQCDDHVGKKPDLHPTSALSATGEPT